MDASPLVPVAASEWRRVAVLATLIVLLTTLPYVLAYTVSADHVFNGILFNPLDGNSYFAKMREGWRGDWLFTLPYTAQPGDGVFIFTYYLFLGHLARWTGANLDLVYHLARMAGGLFLLLSAYPFIARFFNAPRARLVVWLMFALGSGLGWLLIPLGIITSDLWVAEAIPFLSIFSNSHFCFAAGLMLWIFDWTVWETEKPRLILAALAVTALAQVQPMALLTVGVVVLGVTLGRAFRRRAFVWRDWLACAVVGVFAAPWVLYDFFVILTHPVLAGWNAQNITPSPPWWDAIISGGVPLLLALPGMVFAARRRIWPDWVLLIWFGLNVVLLYLPFALQRRLSLGIWMPLCLLAGLGFREVLWPRLAKRWRPLMVILLVALMLPGNLLDSALVYVGVMKRMPELFLTRAETDAIAQLKPGALVLAAPGTGLFIPARSDARVLYGHPYETVDADQYKQAVEDFFAGRVVPETFLAEYPVDYIFYGPREKALGPQPALDEREWQVVFGQPSGEVVVYERR